MRSLCQSLRVLNWDMQPHPKARWLRSPNGIVVKRLSFPTDGSQIVKKRCQLLWTE